MQINACLVFIWQGEKPTTNLKGDKLVGKYYVEFDKVYKNEINDLINKGLSEDEAVKKAPILIKAQDFTHQMGKWRT